MTTILKTFGIYILCFLAMWALFALVIHVEGGLVLTFLVSYILYRLLKENGI